jgi:fatty-acyl-CoA synthase
MLDTDFAGPQLREVVEREGVDLLVLDEEFTPLLAGTTPPRVGVYRAWAETPGDDTLDALGETGDTSRPPRPDQHARVVVLTSGTTGTPKGAPRTEPRGLASIAALLEEATLGSIEHHPAVAGADRRPSSSNATGKVLKRELRKIGA